MRKIPAALWARISALAAEAHGVGDKLELAYDKADSYYSSRSDKWREDANGALYADWMTDLDNARNELDLAATALEDLIEYPEVM